MNKNFIIASLIFGLVMSVYLFTLAPTITMEDSGELVTAAYTLGIAHPSGFPLYTLLGKLFTFIPLGTIAWRVNLMSAFFGALTVSLLYLIIDSLFKNRIIAFCFSLVLAFSPVFWSQSVITEVYTLNSFFVTLLILILLDWQKTKKEKNLLWFSLLSGLSLTNHTMSALLLPAYGLFILLVDIKIIKDWKLLLKMFFLFFLGLAVYFYIPLRAWQQATLNWGPITSWLDVIAHISRAQYNDLSLFVDQSHKTGVVVSFFFEIYKQFFSPTLLLALAGLVYLWQKKKKIAVLTVGIFLFNSLVIIYLRKFGWGLGIDYTYRVYYLPAFSIVIIWLASIASYLYNFLNRFFKEHAVLILKVIKLVFFLVLFSLPVSFLIANYQENDLSDFWFNYDYTKNLLASLEPKSIYYFAYDNSLQGDTEIFSLVYLKMVENFRPDVTVLSEQQLFYKEVKLHYPEEYPKLTFDERRNKIFSLLNEVKDRPLYTNFAVTHEHNDLGLFSLSNGYAHRIYPSLEAARKVQPNLYLAPLRNIDEVDELSDYPIAGLAAHYYYNLAVFYLTQGGLDQSQDYLIKAFNLNALPFTHEYRRFLDYRAEWLGRRPPSL